MTSSFRSRLEARAILTRYRIEYGAVDSAEDDALDELQALRDREVLELIGDDEESGYEGRLTYPLEAEDAKKLIAHCRNLLRAELRQKLTKKESEA